MPDGEHFVTDVPGLGDTTVSAQGQVFVDPRWNNDMLSSILQRKGRRLVTGEGCMRFLTSAGIHLASGQPPSGAGGGNDEQHQVHSLQVRMLPLFGVAQSLRLFGVHLDTALPAALISSWAAASAAR